MNHHKMFSLSIDIQVNKNKNKNKRSDAIRHTDHRNGRFDLIQIKKIFLKFKYDNLIKQKLQE